MFRCVSVHVPTSNIPHKPQNAPLNACPTEGSTMINDQHLLMTYTWTDRQTDRRTSRRHGEKEDNPLRLIKRHCYYNTACRMRAIIGASAWWTLAHVSGKTNTVTLAADPAFICYLHSPWTDRSKCTGAFSLQQNHHYWRAPLDRLFAHITGDVHMHACPYKWY